MAKRVPERLVISYPKGARKMTANNLKQAGLFKNYLEGEFKIPADRISLKGAASAYRVTILEDEVQ